MKSLLSGVGYLLLLLAGMAVARLLRYAGLEQSSITTIGATIVGMSIAYGMYMNRQERNAEEEKDNDKLG